MRSCNGMRGMMAMLVLTMVFVSGCASSKGSMNVVSPFKDAGQMTKYSELVVRVTVVENLALPDDAKERIQNSIIKSVQQDGPERFKAFNPPTPGQSTLMANVMIKRYDKGSKFARAMLAGLGKIHIDGDVCISDLTNKEELAKCEITKTFSLGGVAGAATSIEDVEEGFSKSVAAFILGKTE
jgi:hypothetical protein